MNTRLEAGVARPQVVLFDWDNTLVDSWATIHEALNHVMAAMDKPPWSIAETRARVRLSLRESFPLHFGERWEEARGIYLDRFRAIHLDRLTALPGCAEMLEALTEEGIFLGVVSNKTGVLLRREAEQLGWSRHFGRIVGAGDAVADKPHPAPVGLALEFERRCRGRARLVCRRHRRRHDMRNKCRLRAGAAGRRSGVRRIAGVRAALAVFRACGAGPLYPGLVIYLGGPIFGFGALAA